MNKITQLFLVFFVCSSTLYAQDTKPLEITIENLSRTWELVDLINTEKTNEELKEMLSFLEGTTIELNSDLTSVFTFVQELGGTWVLNDHVIVIKNKRGEHKWTIHRFEKDLLVLSRNESLQKLVFSSK